MGPAYNNEDALHGHDWKSLFPNHDSSGHIPAIQAISANNGSCPQALGPQTDFVNLGQFSLEAGLESLWSEDYWNLVEPYLQDVSDPYW